MKNKGLLLAVAVILGLSALTMIGKLVSTWAKQPLFEDSYKGK